MSSESSFSKPQWWKEATVYQIYPASFKSSGSGNVPGWGDIRGVTSKVDYLKDLGADLVWLSPIYKSPQVDMGYDISDYKDIDPRYGTLEDVDELIRELGKRDMKLMMDLVVNHTSDEHPWFLESKSSKTSAKRDWYIWQPPRYDSNGTRQPPNNWSQLLGDANSAWTWDEATQEYYLSLFSPQQVDLNWRIPAVREAVHDILRFWFDRGVAGFRMDVINLISKVDGYPDAPITDPNVDLQSGWMHFANGPHLHEYLKEMNEKVLSHFDTITVGEMPFIFDPDEILKVVHADARELNMIFIFDLADYDNETTRMSIKDTSVADIRRIISRWQTVMYERNGWNSVFLENHDNPRSVGRYVDESDHHRDSGAKLLAMMLTTLGGTLYVYQGQELGMRNVPPSWPPEEYKDIDSINSWKKVNEMYAGDDKRLEYERHVMQRKARDHSRTPMQWSAGPNAGFCPEGVKPWMRVHDDYKTVNAEAELQSDDTGTPTVFQFWRHALQRRRKHKHALIYGSFECVDSDHPSIFAYVRRSSRANEALLVVLNFSGQDAQWEIPEKLKIEEWIESNHGIDGTSKPTSGKLSVGPWEGMIGRCS